MGDGEGSLEGDIMEEEKKKLIDEIKEIVRRGTEMLGSDWLVGFWRGEELVNIDKWDFEARELWSLKSDLKLYYQQFIELEIADCKRALKQLAEPEEWKEIVNDINMIYWKSDGYEREAVLHYLRTKIKQKIVEKELKKIVNADEWSEIQKILDFFKREHNDEIEKTETLLTYLKKKREEKQKNKKTPLNYA
jgi:hypothetical protein